MCMEKRKEIVRQKAEKRKYPRRNEQKQKSPFRVGDVVQHKLPKTDHKKGQSPKSRPIESCPRSVVGISVFPMEKFGTLALFFVTVLQDFGSKNNWNQMMDSLNLPHKCAEALESMLEEERRG